MATTSTWRWCTTDANVQLRALAHFGVTARRVQNADFPLIEQQIARVVTVTCGYIQRGPVERPTGSGHWLIVRCTGQRLRQALEEPIGGGAYRYAPSKGWAVVVDRAA